MFGCSTFGGYKMHLNKPVRVSLSKQILNQMEQLILEGNWAVGAKIPSEPELVKQFGVSRNTIREAVQSLINAEVLEAKQGDGTYVRMSNRFEAAMLNRLKKSDILDVLEARFAIEKEVVRLAAIRRTNKDLKGLKIHLQDRNNCTDNSQENLEKDVEFHIAVARSTHNTVLFDIYKYVYQYIRDNINNSLDISEFGAEQDYLHDDLFDAIEKQDPDMAEKLTLELIKFNQKLLNDKN
mgnify:FL=1